MAVAVGWASGAVSPDQAARLQTDLTPLGGERGGNQEGTIPTWQGGYTKLWPGWRSGQPRPDPFSAEKPRLRITRENMAEHADKLSDGVQALLRRFPSFRIDVYPTHRTAAVPDWVERNTAANARRARTEDQGQSLEDAFGGVPFPIPRDGAEAMWNHITAWRGESFRYEYGSYLASGQRPVLVNGGVVDAQAPYYRKEGALDDFDGILAMGRVTTTAPPFRAGESFMTIDTVNQMREPRKAWQYLPGQRRVRRTPTLAYDNPSPITSGFSFVDESFLFNGALDRYDWRLVGKQEIYVPYNAHRFFLMDAGDALGPDHPNPDHLRWELHRVWVVEATLAEGKRHVVPRRRFYLDEDSWNALLCDGWDAHGQLWRVGLAIPFIAPELPAVVSLPYLIFDLVKDGYVASSLFNERSRHYQVVPRRAESFFSPAALAGGGIR